MTITDREGRNLSQIWKSQQATIRAEFTAGNISVWFTGQVSSYSITNLVLARGTDEMSISLLCATCRVVEADDPNAASWADIARIVIITTDANTTCTLYELRAGASV